ncbi:7-cyano-7-deazaguanine synthase QueC [Candidatus Peregrinibacteria bacterium]|nr:7-cyano-7-deazaguanine synthase QueC [Candidatus Peregrinibacteria bacterium]
MDIPILLIYSGGLDSTVLLHFLKNEGDEVQAISFSYGQKHSKEIQIAGENCRDLNVPHEILEIPMNRYFSGSLLQNGPEIPEGHYEDENMKQTVVPMRNLIFASIAAGYASSHGISCIALGVHSGDHAIYPDCRPEFISSLSETINLADWNHVEILTPFLHKKKDEIVKIGLDLKVDFSKTWTCYKGGEKPCGKCGSCTERNEAFKKNGTLDPLSEYF